MKASIDLGSNMAQLLVVDDQLRENIYQQFTCLGEGTYLTGLLTQEAIDRTLKVMSSFIVILKNNGVSPAEVVFSATEACRRATNRDELFMQLKLLGFKPLLLNEQQEAYWGCLGAMSQLPISNSECVSMDIGGASTEIAMLDFNNNLHSYLSIKIGTLAVTEWIKDLVLDEKFELIKMEYQKHSTIYQSKTLICARGTMTTLFNLAFENGEAMEKTMHGSMIYPQELQEKLKAIQKMSDEQLVQKYPYIVHRLTTLLAAIEICNFFCDLLKPKKIVISERGLVHGALMVKKSN